VRANRGVLLGLGGYARNDRIRGEHGQPADSAWSMAINEDQGDAIGLGIAAGAELALMDDSWWVPAMFPPGGADPSFVVWERSLPHSVMLDAAGRRFVNEAESYQDMGRRMFQHGAVPAWLVIDENHRRRYSLGTAAPRFTPRKWISEGFVIRATSLDELADRCELDRGSLRATIGRFNGFARAGRDEDFARGETDNDRYYADPTHGPNPSLGPLERPPFYAVKLYPADVGTKGGLVTDEHSRALRADGSSIDGLYAAGNSAASILGNRYAGPGATIGSAMICAFMAMRHAARVERVTSLISLSE
jgi:3-oxosteroid 1-dehydrogenase